MDDLAPNITQEDPILVTGAAGFIGRRVVGDLLARGFRNIRCLVRSSSRIQTLDRLRERWPFATGFEVVKGNLLSPADCASVSRGAAIIYHLAAGTGTKSFPDAFMNSVVATRNLVEAGLAQN